MRERFGNDILLSKVAAFASIHHVHTGFHGATDLSPVDLAASIHFDLAVNNFGIQEYMPHPEVVKDVFHVNYRAKKYPYSMGVLAGRAKDGRYLTYW